MATSSIVQMKAATTVVQGMALGLTVFRVWFRLHIRRFWWEDAWAAAAGLCGVVNLISSWVHLRSQGTTSVVAFWISTLTFTCVNWSARMSILFSITRVARPTPWLFRLSLGFAILFFLMWVAFIAQEAWHCGSNRSWYHIAGPRGPYCRMDHSMAAHQLATSCVADTILVVFSLRLLWNVNLPTRQRRMILAIFSSSIITTLFSLFHITTQFLSLTGVETIAVNLETSSSLIVCNLLVIVTYVYRILNRTIDYPEDDDYSTPTPVSPVSQWLTTIDLAPSQRFTTIGLGAFAETSASDSHL
ncbi:hypothetical protein DFH29DRAFT_946322 [Suillus ampliporus]|nr:hypothetical protein DFH29DRAFT_946322 [Suillus ampliporus]